MKNRTLRIMSAALVTVLVLSVFSCFAVNYNVTATENGAPVILKTEFYDSAKKIGNELPVSDLANYVNDGVKGGYGTPYTPPGYRSPRYTQVIVYVQIADGKTAADYAFRFLSGVVDTSGEVPACRDRYVTGACTLASTDATVTVAESEVDGVPCVVATYNLIQKPSFDVDSVTTEEADGSADLTQLSRYYCIVEDTVEKTKSSTESNAFYVAETYAKTSVRDLVAFIKENYDMSLLTPSVYYKNTSGEYTDKADGAERLPGDKLELALSVPDLADVPHITGMTTESMNSNYSAFTANSAEMYLEWYAANQSEKGEGYEEVYLGTTSYAQHELFHQWYYDWKLTENYVLGTDVLSALTPEKTYAVIDSLSVQYKYVYCKLRMEIKFGTVPGFFGLTTETFEIPGYATEATPDEPVVVKGDVNGDGRVNTRDIMALKKYNSNSSTAAINTANADINGDGRINVRDAVALKKQLAGN